ncbi:fimbrial biogenesis chaperone [Lelliottia wanjuensis]|uniref:Molecular chaperone n=1 Tax=Lelliottia wanjuensis TaxID=3050585 RepID=A0AAP4LDG3_9ENTR|nr:MULTISPECIES: molecular chaperone [unclassified Lelliottia]MDK9366374.1 molecular chaperone [Lelliottia sp. V106_12]MDK9615927.1 molecular chaperone [Lelliottia sp. V106_9]
MKGMASVLAGMLICASAQASIVMTGSRIIYPADSREVSVQLTNRDDFPGVVQVWLDEGNAQSAPQTATAPFITTPPVFRLAAHSGQTVRLRYVGKPVAQDRESLWWFNFVQIPPTEKGAQPDNQLMVLVRSRVKVLMRPKDLAGSPLEMAHTSRVWLQDGKLFLRNHSGYYLALSSLDVSGAGKKQRILSQTVAPWTTVSWPATVKQVGEAQMRWINDQGATFAGRVTPGNPGDVSH